MYILTTANLDALAAALAVALLMFCLMRLCESVEDASKSVAVNVVKYRATAHSGSPGTKTSRRGLTRECYLIGY